MENLQKIRSKHQAGKRRSSFFILIFAISITSCSNRDKENIIVKRNSEDEIISVLIKGETEVKLEFNSVQRVNRIYFKSNGTIIGDVLTIDNFGRLIKKQRNWNSISNEVGLGYSFYKSGIIHQLRFIDANGNIFGVANDFYDTSGSLKSIMQFCNDSTLNYKADYDVKGKLLKEEGVLR